MFGFKFENFRKRLAGAWAIVTAPYGSFFELSIWQPSDQSSVQAVPITPEIGDSLQTLLGQVAEAQSAPAPEGPAACSVSSNGHHCGCYAGGGKCCMCEAEAPEELDPARKEG